MSASFMRSSLVKSLLIDFLLTPVRLPHGDDGVKTPKHEIDHIKDRLKRLKEMLR